jgi:hypothetical protein
MHNIYVRIATSSSNVSVRPGPVVTESQKYTVMGPAGPWNENDCTGEGHQQNSALLRAVVVTIRQSPSMETLDRESELLEAAAKQRLHEDSRLGIFGTYSSYL